MSKLDDIMEEVTRELGPDYAGRLFASIEIVAAELMRARKIHPEFNSPHEGYAVLLEEVEEAWDEIKRNQHTKAWLEMIQVSAMTLRYLVEFSDLADKQLKKLEAAGGGKKEHKD